MPFACALCVDENMSPGLNRHSTSFACVRCFPCGLSVDGDTELGLVAAGDVLPFERYQRFCTLTSWNARSNLCEKMLDIHLDTYQQMPAQLSCFPQWMLLRHNAITSLCPREEKRSLLWSVIQTVSDSHAEQFHTAYRETFLS